METPLSFHAYLCFINRQPSLHKTYFLIPPGAIATYEWCGIVVVRAMPEVTTRAREAEALDFRPKVKLNMIEVPRQ